MVIHKNFWKGKKVFITGHTGFKGSWLSMILHKLNVEVIGYSKDIPTKPSLFKLLNLDEKINSNFGDVRNLKSLNECIQKSKPDIIFHMAAQSLVNESIKDPRKTYSTNVTGTINLFESIRKLKNNCCVINVTTDKCYENLELKRGYKEDDKLGGRDPYSSSKACSELISNSYSKTFFKSNSIVISTVRAGNVIGGGDWSKDRLIPDCIRGIEKNQIVKIRNENSIRPWQFVLEPLTGYMILAEKMFECGNKYSGAWNFGPSKNNIKRVKDILEYFSRYENFKTKKQNFKNFETQILVLDSTKSNKKLGWKPKLDFDTTMKHTLDWYNGFFERKNMEKLTERQIKNYFN